MTVRGYILTNPGGIADRARAGMCACHAWLREATVAWRHAAAGAGIGRFLAPCACLVFFAAGCSWGKLEGVALSSERLSRPMMEFADGLAEEVNPDTGKNVLNYASIPYITKEGQAADYFADRFSCFLLYGGIEEFGKYEEGYGYFEADIIYPVLLGGALHVFDAKGARRYSSRGSFLGVFFPYPVVKLAGIESSLNSCDATGAAYGDYGLNVLEIPGVKTSLLRVATNGFDILFLPLWRADESPREPAAKSGE